MEKSSIEREHYLSFNISQRYDEFSRCRTAFLDKPNNKYFGFLKTKQNKKQAKQKSSKTKTLRGPNYGNSSLAAQSWVFLFVLLAYVLLG